MTLSPTLRSPSKTRPAFRQLGLELGNRTSGTDAIAITASLGVARDGQVLTLLSARPPVPSCTHQIPDRREPMHATAMGKTILAFLPEDVRRRGFAVSDEERTVRAVAVPVFGPGQRAVGAIGVQALAKRLTDELIRDIVPALWHFAALVGSRMPVGA